MPDFSAEDYANRAGGPATTATSEQTPQPDISNMPVGGGTDAGSLTAPTGPDQPLTDGGPSPFPGTRGTVQLMANQAQAQQAQQQQHHSVFRSIMESLAGPSSTYSVDNEGNLIETPAQRSKSQLANSIVAGALTGLFAGAQVKSGPGATLRAFGAGGEAGAAQKQQIRQQQQNKAITDYSRRIATMEANLRIRQTAANIYNLESKAMDNYIQDGQSIMGELANVPGALMEGGQQFSASEIPQMLSKYNVTENTLLPVGKTMVIGRDGQVVRDANGIPKEQLKYVIVDPSAEVKIPDDLLQKFKKYNIPGYANIGKVGDTKTKVLSLVHAINQVQAYETFDATRNKYLGGGTGTGKISVDHPGPMGTTKLPNISKDGNHDPMLQKMTDRYAKQNGIDRALARALVQTESNGNPKAVSPAGAKGLGQIMPVNYDHLGITDPFDAEQNIRGSMKLLKELYDRFGSVKLALAAYNSSPGAVVKAGYDVPDIPETKAYVKKIMDLAGIKDEDEGEESDSVASADTSDPLKGPIQTVQPAGTQQTAAAAPPKIGGK